MHVIRFIQDLARDEEGVTAIEYGLIAALIAVVIIAAVEAVGGGVSSTFNSVANKLPAKRPIPECRRRGRPRSRRPRHAAPCLTGET